MRHAVTTLLLAGLLAGCSSAQQRAGDPDVAAGVAATVRSCDPGEGSSLARATSCYERRLLALVDQGDPLSELPGIDAAVRRTGGFVFENCHILMHWVGRNFAVDRGVTLGTLQNYLPPTNDPGCSAGFAHGMISALGKSIRGLAPREVAAACAASPTRYQAYSCIHGLGHAYMRAYVEDLPLALRACSQLPGTDVVDCAQGAYHDYWFAEAGADNLPAAAAHPSPRELCARQPARFVRACWYRAYLESPPPNAINTPRDLLTACAGLAGLQLQGCVTGASVTFNSGFPGRQLAGCAELPVTLRVSCARGVATQDLAGAGAAAQAKLVDGCDGFAEARRGCVEWIAKALNVDTDGKFVDAGCPRVRPADRGACRAGAAAWRGPLETFS